MKHQECKHCMKLLPTDSFYKTDRSKSGFRGVCKHCSSKSNVARYANSRKHLNKSSIEILPMPPIDRVNELFSYDGENIIRMKSAGCRKKGDIATRVLSGSEYLCVTIDSIRYLAHRVIWFMATGQEPQVLDHINRNKKDNRIENLRPSCPVDNRSNTDVISANTTGLIGVYWYHYKGSPRWRAACAGKHLGYFDSRPAAAKAYNSYAHEKYGEYCMVKIMHNKRVIKEEFGIDI